MHVHVHVFIALAPKSRAQCIKVFHLPLVPYDLIHIMTRL